MSYYKDKHSIILLEGALTIQSFPGMQPSIKPGCSFPKLYDNFMSMLDHFSLVQMVTEPTNVLELFLTTNNTLVQKTEILTGIADHDILGADVIITSQVGRQNPGNIPLYRKADCDGFRKYILNFASDFIINYENLDVEQLWNSFKSAINQGISKFVPIKRSGVKKSLPWITQEIKRLMWKRDNFFHVQRNSAKNKDRHHFKQVKHLIQTKIRTACDNYLQDLLGLAAQNADENPSGFIPKKLYSRIKNARQDSQGISTLYDKKQKYFGQ